MAVKENKRKNIFNQLQSIRPPLTKAQGGLLLGVGDGGEGI
jgi:hypothetical protein